VLTKVLVVDDDTEMTDLLKLILEPNSFEVLAVNVGKDAVQLVQEYNPDVIILDLLMPGMDGWEICEEIRKFSPVPILVLSAISKPGMAARALDAGADDYLLKPTPSGVLVAHLNRLARRARAEHDANKVARS
jgi:DNA-binding response OmpR family regulator